MLPIVELAPARSVTAASELITALRSVGFTYVTHPAVDRALIRDVCRLSRQCFGATLGERQRCASGESGVRGFYRYVGASGVGDGIDCFALGRPLEGEPLRQLRRPYFERRGWDTAAIDPLLSRPNHWPLFPEAAEFRTAMERYYGALSESVLPSLLDHVALGLERDGPCGVDLWPRGRDGPSLFSLAHASRDHNLEAKLYPRRVSPPRTAKVVAHSAKRLNRTSGAADLPTTPPAPPPSEASQPPVVRLDAHADMSTVTFLLQDALGGLEAFDAAAGTFVPLPVKEDCLLVNVGAMLERWTAKALLATPHRVRNAEADAASSDRCSVVFFGFPDHDADIAPWDGSDPDLRGGDLQPLLSTS